MHKQLLFSVIKHPYVTLRTLLVWQPHNNGNIAQASIVQELKKK